jgi:uncharacterized protein DUF3574
MRSLFVWGLQVLALLIMAAPLLAQGLSCNAPQKPMLEISLMFGRNIGGELGVSEEVWSEFVASEITPRFPDGLTVDDAVGQWRDTETARVVKEPSKDVRVVVPAGADIQEKIDAIVAAYKQRFHQQAVGVVIRPACASF